MKLNTLKVFIVLLGYVNCAKILGVFHMAAPSHNILGKALMRALAEKGHDVTIISPFAEKDLPKNGTFRDIVLTGVAEEHDERMKILLNSTGNALSFIWRIPFLFKTMVELTDNALKHPNVQKLLDSDEHFDVVIVEQFNNEAHKAFAAHFNAPLIVFSTTGASSWVNHLVGNPNPTSYVPELLMGLPSKMTFIQRFLNTVMYVMMETVNRLVIFPKQDELVKKYFPTLNKDLDDIMYNVSLVLLNSHSSINYPVPYVPNMIDIGGFHVKPPKKLPKELQKFLDESKEGVIYFSMGSNLKGTMLPIEKREVILNVFSKLKLKVLWKWEEDVLPGQPPNVRLGKWLPQQDILAHPNVKLFITHGGLLSTIETVYNGVQALAIPIGGDQKMNAKMIVNQGFGLSIDFSSITEDELTKSINELLTNPEYSRNAKRKSALFHDRLVDPLETAVYWVEYVNRHRGAPHLRIAGLDLPWYKYYLLDVIGTILVSCLVGLFVFYQLLKKLLSTCCKQSKNKVKIN